MSLTCREVVRLISEGLDRELPAEQQTMLRAHYAICRGCSAVRDRMAFLRRAMRGFSDSSDPKT